MSASYPAAIIATVADLPPAVATALARADPTDETRSVTIAAGIPFSSLVWGDPADRPLVLIHGITASARIWWRIGPGLAATGRRVVAVDQAGHGLTGHWQGHHRFRDNAGDLAAWIRAAGLDVPEAQIVGHSWGGMTAAALPINMIMPATLVLLDPPSLPHQLISSMVNDPSERPNPDLAANRDRLAAQNPDWSAEDVLAKAEGLTQADIEAARSVLLENGDWDAGLADVSDPAADGIPTWLIRGDPMAGGLVPDAVLPDFAARIGADHILTLAGAPHGPQRTHPAATTAALIRALAWAELAADDANDYQL
jgi:pimeloyl-ACP methyl ester carboxylesterase